MDRDRCSCSARSSRLAWSCRSRARLAFSVLSSLNSTPAAVAIRETMAVLRPTRRANLVPADALLCQLHDLGPGLVRDGRAGAPVTVSDNRFGRVLRCHALPLDG